jgi:hypothetical protein
MVIDNLDNLDSLMIMRYIPVRRGTILFTTRDARIIGHPRYLPSRAGVEIGEMGDQEAFETFSQLLGAATDRKISKPLFDRFEKLPLAIAQAAAYIRETGISLGKYLELFQECGRNQRELLNQALPNAIESEPATPRAVMTTWKITIDKIQRESPLSFKLLQLMSFLDPAKIPEELIRSASFLENESTVHFGKALAPLLSFALLSRHSSSTSPPSTTLPTPDNSRKWKQACLPAGIHEEDADASESWPGERRCSEGGYRPVVCGSFSIRYIVELQVAGYEASDNII